MTYKASPRPPEILRLLVRLILFAGAIVAIWLIAPISASASEPSTDLDDPVTDVVDTVETTVTDAAEEPTGTVTDTADSVETTVTEVAEPTGTVTDTVDSVETTVTEVAEATGTVANAVDASGRAETATKVVSSSAREVDRVTSDAGAGEGVRVVADAVSTVENTGDVAGGFTDQLQEAVSTAHPDIISTVSPVETSEFATAIVPIAPRIEHDDGTAISDGRRSVTSVRFADQRAFTIRAPPVTTGPAWAAAASADGTAADSSSGWPGAPDASDRFPPVMGSTARDSSRDGSSFNDVAGILVAIVLALGFARRFSREAELHHKPIFLPLAERPG
jgi:hypothetical protein